MSYDFQTITHGKWILAGEHAVLRGHPALVFPLPNQTLTLHYQQTQTPLHITREGLHHHDMEKLIWRVIHEGQTFLQIPKEHLTGHLHVINHVPLGVGLGASAALCVAIARWFHALHASSLDVLDFAKKLEHVFHGKSSGLDIAGAATHAGGVYFKAGNASPLEMSWSPRWFLSSSGETGVTSHCIQQVQTLWDIQASRAKIIDQHMADSVQQAYHALTDQSEQQLAHAMNQASDCFEQWGLITPTLANHMKTLRDAGALAVKPTGSGGGGHLISLWKTLPSQLSIPLMPI